MRNSRNGDSIDLVASQRTPGDDAHKPIDRDGLRALAQHGDTRAFRIGTAVMAVGFFVGFYLLGAITLAVTAGALWLCWYGGRAPALLLLPPVVASYAFLRACLLFRNRWKDPGPVVLEADQPALFAMVREVSARVGAPVPRTVYLVPEPNAFVAHVGGFMGLAGGRTVMGLGMPLLDSLSEAELRAVVAHEFGHFYGGETRLSGLLYRVYESCVRVIETMVQTGGASWALKPFVGYLRWFLRSSNAARRKQELFADAAGVRVSGKTATANALRKVEIEAAVFEAYLREEISPLVDLSRWPEDLYGGLRLFRTSVLSREGAKKLADGAEQQRAAHPFDSHPSLAERLVFIEACPGEATPDASGPASGLLRERATLERSVANTVYTRVRDRHLGLLAPVAWADAGRDVYVARMLRDSDRMKAAWPAVDDGGIAGLLRWLAEPDPVAVVRAIAPEILARVNPKSHAAAARVVLGRFAVARIATVLVRDRGAEVSFVPGRPLEFRGSDGVSVLPEEMVMRAMAAESVARALGEELRAVGA